MSLVAQQAEIIDELLRHFPTNGASDRYPVEVQSSKHGIWVSLNDQGNQAQASIYQFDSGMRLQLGNFKLAEAGRCRYEQVLAHNGFSYLTHGNYRVEVENQWFAPRAGDLWLMHGSMENMVVDMPAQQWMRGVSIDLSPAQWQRWQEEAPKNMRLAMQKTKQSIPIQMVGRVNESIERLTKQITSSPSFTFHDALTLESQCLALLASYLQLPDTLLNQHEKRSVWRNKALNHAVSYLHEHYCEDFTVSDLAKVAGINQCYLQQGLQQRLGCSIAQYRKQLRLAQAKRFLDSGMSVLDAALAVGYRHTGHFSKQFYQHFGITPKQVKIAIRSQA